MNRGQPKRCSAINVGISLGQHLHNLCLTALNGHMQRCPTICCRNVRVTILSKHTFNFSYIASVNSGSKARGCRVAGSSGFQIANRHF